VLTSLTLGQIYSLVGFVKNLHPTDFQQVVLGVPTYGYYDYAFGKAIVRPIWSAINEEIQQVFHLNQQSTPAR
jgi:hypothetical protein